MSICNALLLPCINKCQFSFGIPSIQIRRNNFIPFPVRASKSESVGQQQLPLQAKQQELNLSVLRFTFGIPGVDESYLPRYIGYTFGSLLLLNHFLSSSPTAPQLRTESIGLLLAAFSIALPYIGRFLKGAVSFEQRNLPEGSEQIFLVHPKLGEGEGEDFAWATYVLLRRTSAVSVLISANGRLCARGYWNAPKESASEWFLREIESAGLSKLRESVYFPQPGDLNVWKMVPKGSRSVLVEPIGGNGEGFVLLASTSSYAYNENDRAWIRAISRKFKSSLNN